jgi:hypothetical protein
VSRSKNAALAAAGKSTPPDDPAALSPGDRSPGQEPVKAP